MPAPELLFFKLGLSPRARMTMQDALHRDIQASHNRGDPDIEGALTKGPSNHGSRRYNRFLLHESTP